MPWATHQQLLTLAHVSAKDARESVMAHHPCWQDPLFAKLVYGTLMRANSAIKNALTFINPQYGSDECFSRVFWGELIFMAHSASAILWHVYKTWNIAPLFVDPKYGVYAPLAVYSVPIHYDQRTVLQALATLTAWHRDPFATTITLDQKVLPPVLLLFTHDAILQLQRAAPVTDMHIKTRLDAFSQFNMEPYMRKLHFTTMSYHITADPGNVYDEITRIAGITSLYGVLNDFDWYNAHVSVLQHYFQLARPADRKTSILPIMTKLVDAAADIFDFEDDRLLGFKEHELVLQHDHATLLPILATKLQHFYTVSEAHYAKVSRLGVYDHGQFAQVCLNLAATPSAFWKITR